MHAYLAGFVDGEGCLSIVKCSPQPNNRQLHFRYAPRLMIVNTNKEILLLIKHVYGGYLHQRKKACAHHKIAYSLIFVGNVLKKLLVTLLPLLVVKRKQAECLLKLISTERRTGRGKGYSSKEQLQKEGLYKKCMKLNDRR